MTVINSLISQQGYINSSSFYDELTNEEKLKQIYCIYTLVGQQGERIQLFYDSFDLYHSIDTVNLNSIELV
jgi:hypothetical protein